MQLLPEMNSDFTYQVVAFAKKDDIIAFEKFTATSYDAEKMHKMVDFFMTHLRCTKIEITRWNRQGERQ